TPAPPLLARSRRRPLGCDGAASTGDPRRWLRGCLQRRVRRSGLLRESLPTCLCLRSGPLLVSLSPASQLQRLTRADVGRDARAAPGFLELAQRLSAPK